MLCSSRAADGDRPYITYESDQAAEVESPEIEVHGKKRQWTEKV